MEQTGCKSEGCERPLKNLALLMKGVDRVGVNRARAQFLPHSLRVIGFEEVKIFELTEVIIEIYQSHRGELSTTRVMCRALVMPHACTNAALRVNPFPTRVFPIVVAMFFIMVAAPLCFTS